MDDKKRIQKLVANIEKMSLKDAISRLNEISKSISSSAQTNSVDIENIIELYEEGCLLAKFCENKLEKAQVTIKKIQEFDYSTMLKDGGQSSEKDQAYHGSEKTEVDKKDCDAEKYDLKKNNLSDGLYDNDFFSDTDSDDKNEISSSISKDLS